MDEMTSAERLAMDERMSQPVMASFSDALRNMSDGAHGFAKIMAAPITPHQLQFEFDVATGAK